MTHTTASIDSLLAYCPDILFAAGPDGALFGASRGFAQALGVEIGATTQLSSRIHPDSLGAWSDAWGRLAGGAESASIDCRVRVADGSFQPFSINVWRGSEGGVVYGLLRRSSDPSDNLEVQILHVLAENMPIALWATDKEGVFTYHAGKAVSAAGLRPGQFVGQSFFDVMREPQSKENIRRNLQGEVSHRISNAFGRWWETWNMPIRDGRGDMLGVLGASLDVTELKRVENELRMKLELVEKQQHVIRSLSTPIIQVWDDVLTMPMVGTVDSVRAAEMMEDLLDAVARTRARYAILDVTGVEAMDTATASHLLKLVHALKLLGAEGIITGIQPAIAQTIVGLGVELSAITTLASLRDALKLCMSRMTHPATGSRVAHAPGRE